MRGSVYLILLAVTVMLVSCGPRLYFPDRANVPAFREAHELKVTAAAKLQSSDGGPRRTPLCPAVDAAYAPISHLGFIASWRPIVAKSGYLYPTHDKPSNYSIGNPLVGLIGQRFEVGAGYFAQLKGNGILEVYGGYGNGALKGDQFFTTSYHRVFVQPEVGYRDDVFCIVGGLRMAAQRYYNFSARDSTLRYRMATPWVVAPAQGVDFLAQTFRFVEPFVNMEIGYKMLAFNAQMGISAQADRNASIIGDSNLYISFGLVARVPPKKRDTKPPLDGGEKSENKREQ